jgi:hypothetical protein
MEGLVEWLAMLLVAFKAAFKSLFGAPPREAAADS